MHKSENEDAPPITCAGRAGSQRN